MADNITPIRQQYLRIKKQYPHVIVFFRLGDFYETFDEDARIAAKELEIVLTSRGMGKGQPVPMAGVPYHAVDSYLAKLITRGYKVAICEQITKPGETKGIVQREVVRLVTPGTVLEPALLISKANNYLVSLVIDEEKAGLAYADITTGEFATTQTTRARVESELDRIKPSEIITSRSQDLSALALTTPVSRLEDYDFDLESATKTLMNHFSVVSLDGYGCAGLHLAIRAAGSIIQYVRDTQKGSLKQITSLSTYSTGAYMALDAQTQNNLELFHSSRTGRQEESLLSVIDLTRTAMGGRLLKKWLGQPLLDIIELKKRQETVGWFFRENLARSHIIGLLSGIADIERLINRIKANIASPRELAALREGLETIPKFKDILAGCPLEWLKIDIKPQTDVIELIAKSLADQPPASLDQGGVIKSGFSNELDELRVKATSSKQFLANLERQERERTGIKSLKVGYNRVFGYYIEVSNANISQVPQDYIRKQTLVGGERFFTPELKEYETLILHAQERIAEMETDIFFWICGQITASAENILEQARALAKIDVFCSLAEVAVRHNYIRPELNEDNCIIIENGRHPVVERTLDGNVFIPNDTRLSNSDTQLVVLTGPNMSGKSTYLRQVALIVLLAQMGSFVPAESACIGLVDRIFTRIGAGEDLAAGKSTFMVEMTETANILNNATARSLIILDEIGRGTSTYDGISIARAVVEYIHNYPMLGAKTLFATHYHELVEMSGFLPRVRNFNVAVTEENGEVVFLRKIMPGGVDKSYGIHVARLAGMPKAVINRAQEILSELEDHNTNSAVESRSKSSAKKQTITQLPLFGSKPQVIADLEKLDIDSLTPLEALTKLYEFKQKAKNGQ